MQMMSTRPENAGAYLTVKEVAAMLQTCTKTILRMAQRGSLPKPVVLSPRCLRFDAAEVLEYLQRAKGAA